MTQSLIQTVVEPRHWEEALSQLCAFTGASKCLLSLRDPQTAQIVIPAEVSNTFASPLISGFTDAEVESYFATFAGDDPWTAVERDNYPYFPYEMSRYFPKAKLRGSPFWKWLKPQSIDESVVCELGRTSNYWAALNLYFDGNRPGKAETVIKRLRMVLPELQAAWTAGRTHQIAKTSEKTLTMLLSAMPVPALLMSPSGRVFAVNDACAQALQGSTAEIEIGEKLRLPADMTITGPLSADNRILGRSAANYLGLKAEVTKFEPDQLPGGEQRDLFLITFAEATQAPLPPQDELWKADTLTDRESTLVRLVANGRKFREAQEVMGVSYPRIMQLWKSARDKLGVADVTELRLLHRLGQFK